MKKLPIIARLFLVLTMLYPLLSKASERTFLHHGSQNQNSNLIEYLESRSYSFTDVSSMSPLIDVARDKRLVLLGESTHGTSEYYVYRDKISRRLIAEQDFNFIVVEGDWPSFYHINRYIKGYDYQDQSTKDLLREHFNRWPQWMWANEEMIDLIDWLKTFNAERNEDNRVGIYGMDVYSKEESINEVRTYLTSQDKNNYKEIASLYDCFIPYGYDGSNYARAIFGGVDDCSEQVIEVVDFFLTNRDLLSSEGRESFFNAKQNAYIVKSAEKHFRAAIGRGPESWNYRVYHMEDTVYRLLDFYGLDSKGIVWAHNTHIGDSRATPMYRQGSHNIGQLIRQKLGRDSVLSVGFGCYTGRVIAGSSWESVRQIMRIPEARPNSWEALIKEVSDSDFYILFNDQDRLNSQLNSHWDHRAIGVVYNPRQEAGNYVPTIIPDRYDAFIFFIETSPLNPLH